MFTYILFSSCLFVYFSSGVLIDRLEFICDRTIITEREKNQTFNLDIVAQTTNRSGLISGNDLWTVDVFFNDQDDGTGNDFSSVVEVELHSGRPIQNPGSQLILNDVEVDLSAANILCASPEIYLCVRLVKNEDSVPDFSLGPDDKLTKCKEITCNRKCARRTFMIQNSSTSG